MDATPSDDGEDVIAITPKGIRVAKKEEPNFTLLWPRRAHAVPLSFAQQIANERKAAVRGEKLASELRTWRKEVAAELGIPAFRIMTNKTLDALVAERPTTLAALSSIFGIYRQTREEYGEDILDIIRSAR